MESFESKENDTPYMVLHVRSLANEEGKRLSHLVKRTNNVVTMRRGQVLLHSAQGFTPPKIGELLGISTDWVRHIITEFNEHGFDSLNPKPRSGGRPPKFDDEIRLEMVNLALTPPPKLGYPFQKWSLRKLREGIIKKGIVDDISVSNLQKIMSEEVLAYQVVRTWKESKDPDFEKKKKRIDRLTRKRHNPPVVISYDEMGPIELRPQRGWHWQRRGHPDTVPATYRRLNGARHLLTAFNYYKGTFFGRLRKRKRAKEVLSFFKQIRWHYPREQRIYLIMDNLSAHITPDNRTWMRKNKVSFVPTPKGASWVNPVECHLADVRKLALTGTNHQTWPDANNSLQAALRFKNSHRKEMLERRMDRRRKRRRLLWHLRTNV
jgi:transposase